MSAGRVSGPPHGGGAQQRMAWWRAHHKAGRARRREQRERQSIGSMSAGSNGARPLSSEALRLGPPVEVNIKNTFIHLLPDPADGDAADRPPSRRTRSASPAVRGAQVELVEPHNAGRAFRASCSTRKFAFPLCRAGRFSEGRESRHGLGQRGDRDASAEDDAPGHSLAMAQPAAPALGGLNSDRDGGGGGSTIALPTICSPTGLAWDHPLAQHDKMTRFVGLYQAELEYLQHDNARLQARARGFWRGGLPPNAGAASIGLELGAVDPTAGRREPPAVASDRGYVEQRAVADVFNVLASDYIAAELDSLAGCRGAPAVALPGREEQGHGLGVSFLSEQGPIAVRHTPAPLASALADCRRAETAGGPAPPAIASREDDVEQLDLRETITEDGPPAVRRAAAAGGFIPPAVVPPCDGVEQLVGASGPSAVGPSERVDRADLEDDGSSDFDDQGVLLALASVRDAAAMALMGLGEAALRDPGISPLVDDALAQAHHGPISASRSSAGSACGDCEGTGEGSSSPAGAALASEEGASARYGPLSFAIVRDGDDGDFAGSDDSEGATGIGAALTIMFDDLTGDGGMLDMAEQQETGDTCACSATGSSDPLVREEERSPAGGRPSAGFAALDHEVGVQEMVMPRAPSTSEASMTLDGAREEGVDGEGGADAGAGGTSFDGVSDDTIGAVRNLISKVRECLSNASILQHSPSPPVADADEVLAVPRNKHAARRLNKAATLALNAVEEDCEASIRRVMDSYASWLYAVALFAVHFKGAEAAATLTATSDWFPRRLAFDPGAAADYALRTSSAEALIKLAAHLGLVLRERGPTAPSSVRRQRQVDQLLGFMADRAVAVRLGLEDGAETKQTEQAASGDEYDSHFPPLPSLCQDD